MARAETVTKLPLSVWAKIMGIHPLHFESVILGEYPHCSQAIMQHEWQNNDHVSREEIARAIAEAEIKMENYLGYRLAPAWEVDEWNPTTRPFTPEFVKYNSGDIRGYKDVVEADWGYFISGGIKSKELILADTTIAYSDADSDGYFETATVTFPTSALDANEISVYYPGKDGDDEWEIRPTNVRIVAGTATVTFRRELVVLEALLEAFDAHEIGIEGTENDNFLETVDAYRVYNDPQTQASFLWEPLNIMCGTCDGDGCSSCAYSAQSGCLILRGDPRNSIVGYSPGTWDSEADVFDYDTWQVNRAPDIVRLYYYAGWRKKDQRYTRRMDPQWERCVAYMAASMLDRPPCECTSANWNKWRQDMVLESGSEDGIPIFREPGSGIGVENGVTDNPFGTRRGEIYAWNRVIQTAKFTSVAFR
jgi:hypothetical protein